MEKPTSSFGLIADANNVLSRASRNVRIAAGNIHNLRVAAETGKIHEIPHDTLVALLKEAQDALDAVAL